MKFHYFFLFLLLTTCTPLGKATEYNQGPELQGYTVEGTTLTVYFDRPQSSWFVTPFIGKDTVYLTEFSPQPVSAIMKFSLPPSLEDNSEDVFISIHQGSPDVPKNFMLSRTLDLNYDSITPDKLKDRIAGLTSALLSHDPPLLHFFSFPSKDSLEIYYIGPLSDQEISTMAQDWLPFFQHSIIHVTEEKMYIDGVEQGFPFDISDESLVQAGMIEVLP
jgi:hypothetical protein